jgi:hypothetical protein
MSQEEPKPESQDTEVFAVYAEAVGMDQPLIQTPLTFGRLIDDIVNP